MTGALVTNHAAWTSALSLQIRQADQPLGEWWEKQAADARWGGRFNDGNHYSLEHEGVK